MRASLLILLTVALGGCGLTLDAPDSGNLGFDAGAGDAGNGSADAGSRDAGPDADLPVDDAGAMDADLPGDDAGAMDAGAMDATIDDAGADAGCADLDDDGVTTCGGDCDDMNPTVYPGAPLICGDGVDNGCLGVAVGDEPACRRLGTYVSSSGSDRNPGTQALPVLTVAQGLANANAIGGGVDVYVAQGRYAEDLTMVETHSILCGYEDLTWTRDPLTYVTDLQPLSNLGVVFPSGLTNLTALDGCTVRGASGATLSAAITFGLGASGVARGNHVFAPDNPSGMSTGIVVYPRGAFDSASNPGTPVIEGNLVEMGRSQAGWTLTSTSVGIWSWRTLVVIDSNTVNLSDRRVTQRAIEVRDSLSGSIVTNNTVRPVGGRSERAFALRVIGGSVDVTLNDLFPGACDERCLAVEVGGNLGRVSFANNQLFGGDSAGDVSAGFLFSFEGAPVGSLDVRVNSNLIVGGSAGRPAVGLGWSGEGSDLLSVGRVRNNIVYAGGGPESYAMWERSATLQPLTLEANALHIPGSAGGMLSGRLYLDDGTMGLSRIRPVNRLPQHTGVSSRQDNCSVIDPRPDGDPHLMASSTCIDRGTIFEAPTTDWDGDRRPMGGGFDIGVDEAP